MSQVLSKNNSGGTLIEAIVAFALVATAAVAILPVFSTAKKQTKYGDVKLFCENLVKGKLDEYRFGKVVNLTTEAASDARLGYLSWAVIPDGNQAGGFLYSKLRYNKYYPDSCKGESQATIVQDGITGFGNLQSIDTMGMRECVGSNEAWVDVASSATVPDLSASNCSTDLDTVASGKIPGFKLYVRMTRDSTWRYSDLDATTGTTSASSRDYSNTCPDSGSWTGSGTTATGSLYDFDGQGDGIRITVTGVMDIASVGLNNLGGISDPSRLMCSATAVVYPFRYPVRYFVSRQGRIYTVHGVDQNGNTSRYAFENLFTQQASGGITAMGIRAIAVHPANFSVYILKSSEILRYSNCGGVPLDCSLTPENDKGMSDDGILDSRPSVQRWTTIASLQGLGVDFRSDKVYGLSGNHTEFYEITSDGSNPLKDEEGCSVSSTPCTASLNSVTSGSFPYPASGSIPLRMTGFFLSPEGDTAWTSDLSAATDLFTSTTYASTIYRATDTTLQYPVATLPIEAITYSQ